MSVPERTFSVLQRQLDAGADVVTGMTALLDACELEEPHEDWRRLRTLDFDGGSAALARWIDDALVSAAPAEADGLCFGLFTPAYDGEEARADVYLRGCRFDPDDGDWACTAVWTPTNTYAHSTLLRDVHRVAYGAPSGLGVDAEYPGVLGFTALAVAAWARRTISARGAIRREVVVGFDSGDLVHVGQLCPTGFRRPTERFRSVS